MSFTDEDVSITIKLFSQSHEELKRELLQLEMTERDKFFFKTDYDESAIDFERNQFFEDARIAYHNYYCYVFARIVNEFFPELEYYERFDGAHVAVGNDKLFFDICGVYYALDSGEFCDEEGDLYWSSKDDEWFLDELNYFGSLTKILEDRLKWIFFQKMNIYFDNKRNKSLELKTSE